MLISLNWLRDFADIPGDIDPRALAERFTRTTAEVEGVEHIEVAATGLIVAEIQRAEPIPDSRGLSAAVVSTGKQTLDTVTAAPELSAGNRVIFAPPGATLSKLGRVGSAEVAGRKSTGMIVDGGAIGIEQLAGRAVKLPPSMRPGEAIEAAGLLDDWVIEIDNKSITHRPDLWGHYGIAREVAAILRIPLKPYPVVPIEELQPPGLPEIPIVIDDPVKSPRYSGIRMRGVASQPAPLWMQVRLSHVGIRPIDLLVDLTNYVMAELGQPMHAFDGAKVDRIEVAVAGSGEKFTTLDGVEREIPEGALMIQADRRSIALAGIMGGADTEVTEQTRGLLLESANFEPATIRRCAAALGHRTEASARFEKSLDPANTVLAIRRFVRLARPELPEFAPASRLSDCFPRPPEPVSIDLDLPFVERSVGRPVSRDEVERILRALEFNVSGGDTHLTVRVPSFRATRDVTIEADLIEEIARFVGYDRIEPVLPEVTVRYMAGDAMHELERRTLSLVCGGMGYNEIHGYIWYDPPWVRRLGFEIGECVTVRNPASAGMEPAPYLRRTLVPGMLRAVELNRHHFERFGLVEVGSVFFADGGSGREHRRLGLVRVAPGRKPAHQDALLSRIKGDAQTWAQQVLEQPVRYAPPADPALLTPWEHEQKTSDLVVDDRRVGRVTVLPAACKRRIDEHLTAWSIAVAEIDLTEAAEARGSAGRLPPVPTHPQVEIDLSVLADASRRYADLATELAGFDHPLLVRLWLLDSYEGTAIPDGKRSFTFRVRLGHPDRTLTEKDVQDARDALVAFMQSKGLELRG